MLKHWNIWFKFNSYMLYSVQHINKMAELPDIVSADYTHFRCVVTIADKEESNYAVLQKSDRDVADLSAIRAEHAADANIPEAVVDGNDYLQLINEREVETGSTSHTICTQLDKLDDAQQSLADYTISPYDTTVVEQVGSEVSDSSFVDNNTLINSCESASVLDNKILDSADIGHKNNVANTVYNQLDDDGNVASAVHRSDDGYVANTIYRSDDGYVANTIYRSDDGYVANTIYRSADGYVANSVLYNGNANDEYDEINDVDVDTYEEIATAEDGVGVYNEMSTEDSEYAEVDTRPNGVRGEGTDIYNELRDTYAATDTFPSGRSSGLSRLSSLSDKQRIIVTIVLLLIICAFTAALAHIILKKDERKTNTNFISNQRELKSLAFSDVTTQNFLEGLNESIRLISINSPDGRLIAACGSKVLYILTFNDSKMTVEKNVTLSVHVNDAVWTTDGHIVCTTVEKSVLRLNHDGSIITINSMPAPTTLCADADGVIYLTDTSTGVYRSTDNGTTWNSLLNMTMDDGWGLMQAIKAFSNLNQSTYDLWTVEIYRSVRFENFFPVIKPNRIRVYTFDKNSHTVQSLRELTLPNNMSFSWLPAPYLASDGDNNVFLAEYRRAKIHLLSGKEGLYDRLLADLTYFELNGPGCLSVDTKRGIMYVGLSRGQIAWFTLKYED